MKRLFYGLIAYPTAGIGMYHTFFGNQHMYGFFILMIGLLGILSDIFFKKLGME